MANSVKKLRILVAKPGLDGHDNGARLVARVLRDAGFEVIYTGLRQTPEMIVNAAIQEDVDCIGLSVLSGAHLGLTEKVMKLLSEKNAKIPVVLGGLVPEKEDVEKLKSMGIKEVFPTYTPVEEIVEYFKKNF